VSCCNNAFCVVWWNS